MTMHATPRRMMCAIAMACAVLAAHAAPAPATSTPPAATGQEAWTPAESVPPPASVQGVLAQSLDSGTAPITHVPWVRARMIERAAAATGAQAGMLARARIIDHDLLARAALYDRAFDFAALELPHGVLPPVITEGRNAYNLSTPDVLRAEGRVFRIVHPARLVATPPTWRDYLWMPTGKLSLPDAAMLPHGADERALWNLWVRKGWDEGQRLADATFRANLDRLQRDFIGMVRYRTLQDQGLVTAPTIAATHLGVTGGGDEMAIDDRVVAIRAPSALDPDARRWEFRTPVTTAHDLATTTVPTVPPPASSTAPPPGGS